MRCQLLFARDERPGVLVLDCVVSDADHGARGVPCAVEVGTPGRSLAEQLALASVRRWAATGFITDVDIRRTPTGGVTVDVRSADGTVATLQPTRVVGLRAVGDLY
jgi:hypothetical protein